MRNQWIALAAISLSLNGIQAFGGEEQKTPKKAEAPRATPPSEKEKPKAQADTKGKPAAKPDNAKRPPDPLEKKTDKVPNKENAKTKMPPDDFGKGMKKK